MSWPTPQDYAEAVQNPRLSFSDPELAQSRPELTSLGLPRPITGNFASVYKMSRANSSVAVRCFFRSFADMGERYAAISRTVGGGSLPYMAGFSYLGNGIVVRKAAYPILKMDWVGGDLLDTHIRGRLADGKALAELAGEWRRMAADLERAGVAHGDLQHGNVLVGNGGLRLVDYDGMFVPALKGRPSHELGHPNYQHPGRAARHFGPYLDRFSLWVIYVSILALSVEPELWEELNAGDERLLLARQDFANPESSPAFKRLCSHTDRSVSSAARQLRNALDRRPEDVPNLESAALISTNTGRLRRHHVPVTNARLPEWLASQTPLVKPARLSDPGPAPRWMLAALATALTFDLIPTTGHVIGQSTRAEAALSLLAGSVAVVAGSYLKDGGVRTRLRLDGRRLALTAKLRWLESRLAASQKREERLRLNDERAKDDGEAQMRLVDECHRERLKAVQQQVKVQLAGVTAALSDTSRNREAALIQALATHRAREMQRALRANKLWSAPIRQLGPLIKFRLWASGVRSAADVDAGHASALDRLSGKQAAALLEWRESVRPAAPIKLPSNAEARVTRSFDRRLRKLEKLRRSALLSAAPVLAALNDWKRADQAVMQARMTARLQGSQGLSGAAEADVTALEA